MRFPGKLNGLNHELYNGLFPYPGVFNIKMLLQLLSTINDLPLDRLENTGNPKQKLKKRWYILLFISFVLILKIKGANFSSRLLTPPSIDTWPTLLIAWLPTANSCLQTTAITQLVVCQTRSIVLKSPVNEVVWGRMWHERPFSGWVSDIKCHAKCRRVWMASFCGDFETQLAARCLRDRSGFASL